MKNIFRLFALLIVMLAATATPSRAIIPDCAVFCTCVTECDWGCWDYDTRGPKTCADWCGGVCGVAP
jgi:hypothetical protein